MFTLNIDPVLFSLGPLEIRYYGLVYVIGFLLAIYFLQKKRDQLNLTKDNVYDLTFWLMLSILIGSRLYHILVWEPAYYLANPIKIFYFWEGGMAFHGGLIGGIISGIILSKKYKIQFLKFMDILCIPALIALALGRIANFINAETSGIITNVPWCVNFGDNLCRHPVQIYATIKRFTIAGIILLLLLSKKQHKSGFLFFTTVTLLGLGRFFIDFLREDVLYLYLSVGQWSSLAMIIIGTFFLIKNYKKELKKLF